MKIQQTKIDRIISLHSELEALFNRSLDAMIELGGMLAEIKAELPHGEFTGWIEENLPFTPRTARRYMRVHARRDMIAGADSITNAYRLLEEPKTDTVSVMAGIPMSEEEDVMCRLILADVGHHAWHGFKELHGLPGLVWETLFGEQSSCKTNEERKTIYFTPSQKMKALFAIEQLKEAGYKWIERRDQPLTKKEDKELRSLEAKDHPTFEERKRYERLMFKECDYISTRWPGAKIDYDTGQRKGDLENWIPKIGIWRENIDDLDRIKEIIERTPAA